MDKIDELLTRGVEKIYPSREELEKVLRSGKKLLLYQGFDPTGIQLHIGHMTGLRKLRQWQDLGHQIIFLIGDGTGQAGDPSGKTRSRDKYLTIEQLRQNAKDYVLQASKIVKFEGENAAEIKYNGDWLNKLGLIDILNIAEKFTLQQLEERDLYSDRKAKGEDINFREFLYPLLQAYDSVAMNVDLELGGSDQTFNMLRGRDLVRAMLNKEKFVMTTPLLVDSSGKKIGKTEGNVIALTSKPNELFGMIMSLGDDIITKSFEFLTDLPIDEVKKIESEIAAGANPMIYKKRLAFDITSMLNSQEDAKKAQEYFESTVQKGEIPSDIQTIKLKDRTTLVEIIVSSKTASSNSEAKRLLSQGAVEIDGKTFFDPQLIIEPSSGNIIKIGKRKFIKII